MTQQQYFSKDFKESNPVDYTVYDIVRPSNIYELEEFFDIKVDFRKIILSKDFGILDISLTSS